MSTKQADTKGNTLPFLLILFTLSLAIFGLYWQTLEHAFVYDDIWYIVNNPKVSNGLSLEGMQWAFTFSEKESSYYHPLSWLSHMLDVELYGLDPAGHHLSNLLFHWLNTLLLFRIFWIFTNRLMISTIIALLFAIHPINIETVAWVAERKNVLSTFFGFCTLLSYKQYTEAKTPLKYLILCALFLASLLAKPALAILPGILLILDIWPLSRLQSAKELPWQLIKLIAEKIPLFALSIASVFVASASLDKYANINSTVSIPLDLRLANALVIPVKYIGKIMAPTNQSILYPFPSSVPLLHWLASLCLLCIISFIVLKAFKQFPSLFCGWFWFLVSLLPVSGLMQAGLWPSIADRWAYFPVIGIFIIIAWAAETIYRSTGRLIKTILIFCSLAATVYYMAFSYNQIQTWQSPLTLFQQAIRHAPDSYVINLNYANALADTESLQEATKYYQKALAINNRGKKAHLNLANTLTKQNNYRKAIPHYIRAAELFTETDPLAGQIHFALGRAYEHVKDKKNAAIAYAKTIQLDPEFIDAYNTLGIVLAEQGKIKEAVAIFQKGLQIQPDDQVVKQNLEYSIKLLRRN